jgi:hypothetical protein
MPGHRPRLKLLERTPGVKTKSKEINEFSNTKHPTKVSTIHMKEMKWNVGLSQPAKMSQAGPYLDYVLHTIANINIR